MDELGKVAANSLVGVLVGQLVLSLFFLLAFVPRVRRSLDIELPAQLTEIKGSLAQLHADVSGLREALASHRERVADRLANHDARLNGLERDGDSTRGGPRG